MKRHGNLWDKIVDPDNLYKAYRAARKGKGWRKTIRRFEKNVNGNLLKLQRDLCTGTFTTSEYSEKTVYEPKKRQIYKLPFYPDRVVQHALLQVLIPIWDNLMIYDSYACRENKGMHQASKKTMGYVKKYRYCFKADISKFYPSIDHQILLKIIRRKIKCKPTLNLLEDIICSYPGGKNTPIGNYTSQWFGNLYMNEVDQLIKHKFKIKAYIRYCDDFVLFHNSKETLKEIKDYIESFLSFELELRFSKWSIFPVTQGVDFLGYRHFPNKVLLRKSSARRIIKRISKLPRLLEKRAISLVQYRSSIASTEGWLKWANTYNLTLALKLIELKEVFTMRGFPKYINDKQDVLNLLPMFPEQTKTYLQSLVDTKDSWFNTGSIPLADKGITDATHKVVENTEQETGTVTDKYQFELMEDPNGTIFRLGFDSVQEVEALIAG